MDSSIMQRAKDMFKSMLTGGYTGEMGDTGDTPVAPTTVPIQDAPVTTKEYDPSLLAKPRNTVYNSDIAKPSSNTGYISATPLKRPIDKSDENQLNDYVDYLENKANKSAMNQLDKYTDYLERNRQIAQKDQEEIQAKLRAGDDGLYHLAEMQKQAEKHGGISNVEETSNGTQYTFKDGTGYFIDGAGFIRNSNTDVNNKVNDINNRLKSVSTPQESRSLAEDIYNLLNPFMK